MTFSSAGCRRVAQIRIDLFSNRISCLQDVFLRAGNNLRLSLGAISELYTCGGRSHPNQIARLVILSDGTCHVDAHCRDEGTLPLSVIPFFCLFWIARRKFSRVSQYRSELIYYIWEAGNSRATKRSTPTCATRRQPGMTTVYKSSWCGWGRSSGGEVTLDSKRAFSSSFLTMCKIL